MIYNACPPDSMEQSEEQIKGQQQIDEWFASLPLKVSDCLTKIEQQMVRMNSFDLLSNISLYNHIHDADQYADYRGDKMFAVSELITLLALKKEYVESSFISMEDCHDLIQEVQTQGFQCYGFLNFLAMKTNKPDEENSIQDIANKTMRDETTIRNPGFPEHHLEFARELYEPLETDIQNHFGFTVKESIVIRDGIFALINKKYKDSKTLSEERSLKMAMEVYKYRATSIVPEGSSISEESFIELNKLSRKKIAEACKVHCLTEMIFHLGETFCFTAEELSDFAGINISALTSFLRTFSCTFMSVGIDEKLVGPTSILKTKPLVEYKGRFLLPSFPLLTWCVEPVIEDFIKSVPKLQSRFNTIKHDFLLSKGIELLSGTIRENATISTNLFYYEDCDQSNRYETDGIIECGRTLFILEAKGHRISKSAKEGSPGRTEKHLKEMIKASYDQGLRALRYIESAPSVSFHTKKNKKVDIRKSNFDDFIIISLTLEPIGNITPLIRATNELGYFKKGIFPWIISVYDLIVVADHLEYPSLLIHYIKRRKEFLERKIMQVFDELDLLAYYLDNRLYIEDMYNDAVDKNASIIHLGNQTDGINNYYVQKYRNKKTDFPKIKPNLPENILGIIYALENSGVPHKYEILNQLLNLPPSTNRKLSTFVEIIKGKYFKDGLKHDCAVMTMIWNVRVGFSFMTGPNKNELDASMVMYCNYKLSQTSADIWVGIGDIDRNKSSFEIQSSYVVKKTAVIPRHLESVFP
jgi:hypothetical protein